LTLNAAIRRQAFLGDAAAILRGAGQIQRHGIRRAGIGPGNRDVQGGIGDTVYGRQIARGIKCHGDRLNGRGGDGTACPADCHIPGICSSIFDESRDQLLFVTETVIVARAIINRQVKTIGFSGCSGAGQVDLQAAFRGCHGLINIAFRIDTDWLKPGGRVCVDGICLCRHIIRPAHKVIALKVGQIDLFGPTIGNDGFAEYACIGQFQRIIGRRQAGRGDKKP